jgi:TetR/AcrR family transcriptional repressor of nem operon
MAPAGGFYKHFDSRDELVAEAVSAAFGIWQRQKEAAESGGQPLSVETLIDDYLSDAHRKNPGSGCAFSALAPEIARSDERTRALTSEQVRNDLELIVGLLPGKDKRAARSRAIVTFSALVGAMSLARAVSDESLSHEILKTVADLLKTPRRLGEPRRWSQSGHNKCVESAVHTAAVSRAQIE